MNDRVGWSKHLVENINQNSNNTMPVMLCVGATFVKKTPT